MNVRFTGRHVGVGDEDRVWAEAKVASLAKYHRNLNDLEVRVERDGGLYDRVELEAHLGHQRRAVGKAEAAGFRAAFEHAAEALRRQLQKDKERVVDRRRRRSAPRRGGGGEGR